MVSWSPDTLVRQYEQLCFKSYCREQIWGRAAPRDLDWWLQITWIVLQKMVLSGLLLILFQTVMRERWLCQHEGVRVDGLELLPLWRQSNVPFHLSTITEDGAEYFSESLSHEEITRLNWNTLMNFTTLFLHYVIKVWEGIVTLGYHFNNNIFL